MEAIFPVAYFGNIAYFRELFKEQNVLLESKEHFVKQTIRTRCEILTANGVQQLNIPVKKTMGSKTPMDEIEISFDTDWRKIHWKSIESAYASSPFFDHYGMEVKELIYANIDKLFDFNLNITNRIIDWLSLDLKIKRTLEFEPGNSEVDYRKIDFILRDTLPVYMQTFGTKKEFIADMSILDLIFSEGPLARNWIVA